MTRLTLPAALILALALTLTAFSGAALAQDSSIDVELGDFYIDMPTTIPAGPVTLNVSSVGSMPHTIIIDGNGVSLSMPETLTSGSSTTWEIDLEPGTYTFWCPIGNHRDQGMEITITVAAAEEEPTPAPAEPTATTPPADPTAPPAAADPTPTVDDDYTDPSTSPNTPTPDADDEADATPTALPGLPDTGAGGSQSNGASTATIAGLAALVLLITATGGGLFYRRQRQIS